MYFNSKKDRINKGSIIKQWNSHDRNNKGLLEQLRVFINSIKKQWSERIQEVIDCQWIN